MPDDLLERRIQEAEAHHRSRHEYLAARWQSIALELFPKHLSEDKRALLEETFYLGAYAFLLEFAQDPHRLAWMKREIDQFSQGRWE